MKLFLAFFLMTLPVLATADLAADIQKELAPFDVLRGNFDQTKTITIIKRPLKSSGTFVLLKGKGVLWNTLTPLASTLKLTNDGIEQIQNGSVGFHLKTAQQPALALVNQVLFSLFAADLGQLGQHFTMHGHVDGHHWQAVLTPKDAWMSKVAQTITLEGGRTLESLQISESNGDHTSLRFHDIQLHASLSASEKALFE